jgi:SAM-dependent methyltransferase
MDEIDLDRLSGAYGPSFPFHDENVAMLSWCAERMIRALRSSGARSLVSLGIGHQVVGRAVVDSLAETLSAYTIVEGSSEAIARFEATGPLPSHVRLVHALFEEFEAGAPVDAVEMGFVLEHVEDPALLLRRYRETLNPGGTLYISVPNACSLHRLFGQAAGLLPDLYRLSPEDLQLGHKRYFDLSSITRLIEEAGLRVVRAEGIFLKCLTTAQLAKLRLPPEVWRSFFEVGVARPEISNAIYLETIR